MKDKNNNRDKWLHVRLTTAEHDKIINGFKSTTEVKISAYIRKLILAKPMIKGVKNVTLTEIVALLKQYQRDLNGVANNFNQAIKKLHTSKDDNSILGLLLTLKLDEKKVVVAMEELQSIINKTTEKWLQE